MGTVRLTKRVEFSASHRYHNPAWSPEQNRAVFGRCNNPHGHGHNYLLEVTIEGESDPVTGMVVNLSDLKVALQDVLEEFDHKDLNHDTTAFTHRIPTTEHFAAVLWERLARRAPEIRVATLRLYEEEDLFVDYQGRQTPRGPEVALTRRYHFPASHRLHAPALSDEENRRVFGKCNNPHGHGHNYTVEVTIRGEANPETGMVADLGQLDRVVEERVLSRFDHQHLDYDPIFATMTTTGENFAKVIWSLLEKAVPAGRLERIGLVETRDNYFEYRGPALTHVS